MVARVLEKTGATVQAWGVMYKAVAQSLFLYSQKRWVVTGYMLKVLEGFHHLAEQCITCLTEKRGAGGELELPPSSGGNGSRGDPLYWVLHPETAGDHSGKSGLSPHL